MRANWWSKILIKDIHCRSTLPSYSGNMFCIDRTQSILPNQEIIDELESDEDFAISLKKLVWSVGVCQWQQDPPSPNDTKVLDSERFREYK